MFEELDEIVNKFYQDADKFINKMKGETKDEEN